MDSEKIERIARVVHESVRAWKRANGQPPIRGWGNCANWMRESTRESVRFEIDNPDAPPSHQHDQWMAQKVRDGWTYGPERDNERKKNPLLIPYEDLPELERKKDLLIKAIVTTLK